jgi:outer membrane protein assembly factor BamD
MKNYPEAVGEYRRLLTAYPVSPFADDAQYQLGMCFYDQSPDFAHDPEDTYAAIDEFSVFLNRYPQSPLADEARARMMELYEKLAKKMYKNGELYLKLNDYEPALLYFDQVRDNYPDTEWARRALFKSGFALLGLERRSDALETFQNFVIAFPDHELSQKAREQIEKIQSSEDGG